MNYFENHTILTLIGLAVFPRITLMTASFASGGPLSPVLVIVVWLCALGGAASETKIVNRQTKG